MCYYKNCSITVKLTIIRYNILLLVSVFPENDRIGAKETSPSYSIIFINISFEYDHIIMFTQNPFHRIIFG